MGRKGKTATTETAPRPPHLFKRFVAYYKPHKKLFALDMLAALFIAANGMVYPVVTNRMLNDLIPERKYRAVVIAGVVVLVLYLIRMLLRYFVQYYGHMIGVGTDAVRPVRTSAEAAVPVF